MANIQSNIKAKRKSDKRKIANKSKVTACKTLVKKAKIANTQESINKVNTSVDSLASKGIYHKNKTNRIKSRLAKKAKIANESK